MPGGPRNCIRCRFLVSGVPYLVPTWGHSNAISARLDALHLRIAEKERELETLKQQRRELSRRGEPSTAEVRRRIGALEAQWAAEVDARDQAFADLHATMVQIEQIRGLMRLAPGDTKIPMILRDAGIPSAEGRVSTRFELVDAVVQMSRFYPSHESDDCERERDNFIEAVLHREGYVSIRASPLSAEEKRASLDALSAMILIELGAQEAESLLDGRKTLADFDLQQRLEDVCKGAIGKPLQLLQAISQGQAPTAILEHASGLAPEGRHLSRL